jgi:Leucine-rich repeat (LRR) protein
MRAAEYAKRLQQWLGRLTHVCLSSNQFTELPGVLLAHGEQLVELDLAYNPRLQVGSIPDRCGVRLRGPTAATAVGKAVPPGTALLRGRVWPCARGGNLPCSAAAAYLPLVFCGMVSCHRAPLPPCAQVTSKCASAVRGMPRLRRLRLEKSYFLPASLRWTPASQRSISRLQRECPDISVECQSHAVQFHLTW